MRTQRFPLPTKAVKMIMTRKIRIATAATIALFSSIALMLLLHSHGPHAFMLEAGEHGPHAMTTM
jgi:hypothetical protein